MSKVVQLEIDFPAKDREGWLKDVRFPKGMNIKEESIAAVLNQIVKYANSPEGNFESEETIAAYCKMSLRKVQRALNALRAMDLITIAPVYHPEYQKNLYHRRVIWDHLRILVENQRRVEKPKSTHSDPPFLHSDPPFLGGQPANSAEGSPPFLGGRPATIVADNTNESKRTTTGSEIVVVVASLKALEVKLPDECLTQALDNGRSIEEIRADIVAIERMPLKDRPGNYVNRWIVKGSRPPDAKPITPTDSKRIDSAKLKRIRNNMRESIFKSNRNYWLNAPETELEAEIDRRLKLSADRVGTNHQLEPIGN